MKGKKIIVGISGGIAAYKSAILVRLLRRSGHDVQVVMTEGAKDFITPLTLSTLSGRPVLSGTHNAETGQWNNHVELGLWADAIIVAPCTANTLAKLANGLCDNLLMATLLSARCPVAVAPAMDLDMWAHPATKRNVATLRADGIHLIGPESGELASGLSGEGRMSEPEAIVETLHAILGHA